jgi:hypothetical protein
VTAPAQLELLKPLKRLEMIIQEGFAAVLNFAPAVGPNAEGGIKAERTYRLAAIAAAAELKALAAEIEKAAKALPDRYKESK